jgi:hypothetical protein
MPLKFRQDSNGCCSEIYNSKSEEIFVWDQKGKLFNLKFSSSMPSFIIFGHQEVCV